MPNRQRERERNAERERERESAQDTCARFSSPDIMRVASASATVHNRVRRDVARPTLKHAGYTLYYIIVHTLFKFRVRCT